MTIREQLRQALFSDGEDEQIVEDVAITFCAYSQGMLPLTKGNEEILRDFYKTFKKEIYGTDDLVT